MSRIFFGNPDLSVAITGTGSVTFAKPTLAATGLETFTGTGAVAFAKPSIAGTGATGLFGSGGVTFTKPTLLGAGAETFAATGGVAFTRPSLAGTGAEAFSGTGGDTFAKPAVGGSGIETFTGSGGVTFAKPALAGSGAETFSASGGVIFTRPSLAGSGSVTAAGAITGAGGVVIGQRVFSENFQDNFQHGGNSFSGSGTVTAGVAGGHGGWTQLQARVKRAPRLPQPVIVQPIPQLPVIYPVYGAGGVRFGPPSLAGTGELSWPMDEWLLGISDEQLAGAA